MSEVRSCPVCLGPVVGRRSNAIYCSAECHSKGSKHRRTPEAKRAKSQRRRRAARQWLAEYKVAAGCIDCGYRDHHAALQIDHNGPKTGDLSQMRTITKIRVELERGHCVVRCANCHAIKSWETKAWETSEHQASTSEQLSLLAG